MIIKTDKDTIHAYLEDVSNLRGGNAERVLIPESEEELSRLLKKADSERTPVTISGGGTGTAGSRIPFGGIVVSMERLNKIHNISGESMSAVVEAGVLVDDLKNACERKGLFYTSHPTEKTAFVGGTVSTNASGSRSFKYGPARDSVKSLRMLMANGCAIEIRRGEHFLTKEDPSIRLPGGEAITFPFPSYRSPDIKNSAGYFIKDGMDAIDLFIGQEGTLSVITKVEVALAKMPSKILSCFVFFAKEEDAWGFAETARDISKKGGQGLEALSIEYFDDNALRFVRAKNGNVPAGSRAAIFFEQEISESNEDLLLSKWLELISRHNASLDDTWVAMNDEKADEFTKLRHLVPESINELVRRSGYQKLHTDIAVPPPRFREIMDFYMETFKANNLAHTIFGHIGECHVHTNTLPGTELELLRAKETVLSLVKKGVALGGTISAEHGVGKTKREYLEIMYGKNGILEMARIKKALDPNCILGLDNIFPRELLDRA